VETIPGLATASANAHTVILDPQMETAPMKRDGDLGAHAHRKLAVPHPQAAI
jgi:hypothetical protein